MMNKETFAIRHSIPGDATAIAEIYNEAIRSTTATFDPEPKTVEDRVRWLEGHDERHPVFVAEVDGRVVGWGALTKWSDRTIDRVFHDRTGNNHYCITAKIGKRDNVSVVEVTSERCWINRAFKRGAV